MPNDNVVPFTGETTLDLQPDLVLEAAKGQLESVLIIGERPDGTMYYGASSSYIPNAIFDLEKARCYFMRLSDEGRGA